MGISQISNVVILNIVILILSLLINDDKTPSFVEIKDAKTNYVKSADIYAQKQTVPSGKITHQSG